MLIFSFTHGALLFILRQKRKRRPRTSDKVTNQVPRNSDFTIFFSDNIASPEVASVDIPLSDIITNMMEEKNATSDQGSGRLGQRLEEEDGNIL